jgi:hypothetical protein
MDQFFSQKYCDRCGGSLEGGRTISMFNEQCICMSCKEKETKGPWKQIMKIFEKGTSIIKESVGSKFNA